MIGIQKERAGSVCVCLPESFEWLLLSSGLVRVASGLLDEPSAFIDSKRFFSWEQFFTHYLREATRGTAFEYRKERLADAYLVKRNADAVMAEITYGNLQ